MAVATKRRAQNREWCNALELRNMAQIALVSAVAASKRAESRGVHMREDCPNLDNAEWRRHIIVTQENGAPVTATAKVVSNRALPEEIVPYEGAIVRAAQSLESMDGGT